MQKLLQVLRLCLLLGAVNSLAQGTQSVRVAWDANTEPDLAGYVVHYGSASRTYTNAVNVGNVTTVTLTNLVQGGVYYVAVTAYSTTGLSSDFSNEILCEIPASADVQSMAGVPVNPEITWPTPGNVVYGTALSGTQLNAAANVPGTFTYNPPLGVVLPAGSGQVLTAVFTPSDATSYNTVTATVALAVLPAPLRITADGQNKTYGAVLPLLTASYSGLVNGDTPARLTSLPALSTTAAASSPVGAYPVTVGGAASPNYAITYVNGSLTVTPAVLTVTADAKSRVYGQGNPAFTASYSGFVNGETAAVLTTPVVLVTTATSGSPAGGYAITASRASAANYAITYRDGTLTITPAASVITWAAPDAALYGTALGAVQLNATSGGVPGSFAYSPATGVLLGAGTHTLTVQFTPTDTVNYTTASATVQWVVNKAPLTITAGSKSRVYNQENPPLTASYSGFVNGEAATVLTTPVVLATTATSSSPVGEYAITASGAAAANYAITYGNGTLTITPVDSVITWAAPDAALYGTALGAVQLNATSAGVPGSFAYSPAAGVVLGAGTHTLTVQFTPTDTVNHAAASATVQWVVNKAPLTITAEGKTKVYGASLPALTATYAGFASGDSAASLASPVSLSTSASGASHVGSYPITLGGASSANYSITYVDGTLSVTPATLTITADNKSMVAGSIVPSLTATYNGFVNDDGPASLSTPVQLATAATSSSPAGNYPIKASGAANSDYVVTYVEGVLTVTPASLVSLAVTAATNSLAVGLTQQLTVLGSYSDGTTRDLTASASWASSTPSVATVNSAGLVTAIAVGSTTVSASQSEVSGSTSLNVVSDVTSQELTFANSKAVIIPSSGASSPYPSTIDVSGMNGTIVKVTVTLNNFTHTGIREVNALLVGPSGAKAVLMANAGGNHRVSNLTLTFDDLAGSPLPAATLPKAGAYVPTCYGPSPTLPGPAPAGPHATNLSTFKGFSPNGEWALYVADITRPNSGGISGGWQLTISTEGSASGSLAQRRGADKRARLLSQSPPVPSSVSSDETLPVASAEATTARPLAVPEESSSVGASEGRLYMMEGMPPKLTMTNANGQMALTLSGTVGASLTVLCATNLDEPYDWLQVTNVTLTDAAYSGADTRTNQSSMNVLCQAFAPARQVWVDPESSPNGFKVYRVTMPHDYAILADQVLRPKGYATRLIAVRMPGLAYETVCYVTPESAYIHFDSRTYVINLEGSGPTIREIATRVSASLNENWTSASEFTFSNGNKQMVATVVKTQPPKSDPVPGARSQRITIGF